MTLQAISTSGLFCESPITAIGEVHFDLNPAMITASRTSSWTTPHTATPHSGSGGGAGTTPGVTAGHGAASGVPTGANPLTLTLNKLVFYGLTTQMNCDRLLSWAQLHSKLPEVTDIAESVLPTLTFTWGSPIGGFSMDGYLSSVTVKYTRFLPEGTPIRADVDLTLKEKPSTLPLTNPTSGGMAGRRSHTLVAGENLQALAVANYGKAGVWRRIAEANDIDDPLRIAVGRRVYLPSGRELRSRSDR